MSRTAISGSSRSLIKRSGKRSVSCLFCIAAGFHTSARRVQDSPKPVQSIAPQPASRPHVRARDGELVPKPLSRPLGLPTPPQAGQNSGTDTRSWRQRRDDFTSYDKHLARRQTLMKDLYEKNYFRDIGNLGKIHKGKSILAPSTPFRANLALYFPNLQGMTLESRGQARDTTPVLQGKVSVVTLMNTEWAKEQCQSFVGETVNPALHDLLAKEDLAQQVEISVEENWLKALMIRLFMPRLRRLYEKAMHGRYFLIRQGLDDHIREALGVWNGKVGYVFLLDGQCRVRWAGNGPAREDERLSLVNCLRRLVEEGKGVQRMRVTRQDAKPTRNMSQLAHDSDSQAVSH